MANVGNRVMNEVRTFTRAAGIEFESGEATFDINNPTYKDTFKASGLAGASPRVRNGFLGLAIQRAIAFGLGTGRALSDKDVDLQLKTLGKNRRMPIDYDGLRFVRFLPEDKK